MSFRDDLIELLKVKAPIGLSLVGDEDTMHHFENVIISHGLPNEPRYLLQLLKPDLPSLFLVIHIEHTLDPILCLTISGFLAHHFDEFLKLQDLVLFS